MKSAEYLRQEFANRAKELRSDLNTPELAAFLEAAAEGLDEKQIKLDAMFKAFDEHGMGLIYKSRQQQFGFVLPDASTEGAFRYALFDKRGFFGHSTFTTVEEAIVELCANGYCERTSDDTLDKMQKTRDWLFGTKALALRTKVEGGSITWEEAEREYAALEEKYDPDLWVDVA